MCCLCQLHTLFIELDRPARRCPFMPLRFGGGAQLFPRQSVSEVAGGGQDGSAYINATAGGKTG